MCSGATGGEFGVSNSPQLTRWARQQESLHINVECVFLLLQCVATASGDATIKLWAVADFSCVKTFEGHTNSVLKAVFLTRGMQIASR